MRVLDTDVCVEILRGNAQVLAARRSTSDRVATTWITAAELFFGAAHSNRPEENEVLVRRFLGTLHLLGLDGMSVELLGRHKSRLEREGRRVADADLLIASIALAHNAILITGNERHYERIPDLSLENWIRADAGRVHERGAEYDS